MIANATKKRARRGRSEGSIFQRGDGLWVGTVSLGYNGAGKRHRRTVYGTTKREVQDKLDDLRPAARAGTLGVAAIATKDYLKLWLNAVESKISDGTFERYEQITTQYLIPAIGTVKLASLRPLHVEQCYTAMQRDTEHGPVSASATTRRASAVVLGIALRHAVRLKMIPSNPAADVSKPRVAPREASFLTPSQARQFLLAAKDNRLYPLYATSLGTGLRQGELLGLKWPDVDFDAGTLRVRRSLSQIGGTFIQRSNLLRAFTLIVKRARRDADESDKLPASLRFHDLRHSHASCLIAAGSSIKAVSRRLGHADITVTLKVYCHCLPDDDAKLAAGAEALFKGVG